jgi:hypothetical protein
VTGSKSRTGKRGVLMQPRYVITIATLVVIVGMVFASFFANVMRPHNSSKMEGMPGKVAGGSTSSSGGMAMSGSGGDVGDAGAKGPIPGALAGVPLNNVMKGEEAMAHIEELHGQPLGRGTDQAWLAHFADGKATLWVTRSIRRADATSLIDRMTAGIAKGGSPFTNSRPLPDVDGYRLEGMGEEHFYFIVGNDVYWLAISPDLADQGFKDLLSYARRKPQV